MDRQILVMEEGLGDELRDSTFVSLSPWLPTIMFYSYELCLRKSVVLSNQ